MLSVVDLLEAGTMSQAQAAWLLHRILRGSSWLVGARPGGAGKTTVMSALLAMAPRDSRVWLTNRGSGWSGRSSGDYIVAYELSPGFYDAYIWGRDVARMTQLGRAGCRIVSNLHADTLEQARKQIVGQCGATEEGFRAFSLFIPLALTGSRFSRTPVVERIDYVRDGRWRHCDREESGKRHASADGEDRAYPTDAAAGSSAPVGRIAEFLSGCLRRGVRLIEEVREEWLEWCDRNGAEG